MPEYDDIPAVYVKYAIAVDKMRKLERDVPHVFEEFLAATEDIRETGLATQLTLTDEVRAALQAYIKKNNNVAPERAEVPGLIREAQ